MDYFRCVDNGGSGGMILLDFIKWLGFVDYRYKLWYEYGYGMG